MTVARLDRLEREFGEFVDRHEGGLSLEVLARYKGRFVSFCREMFRMEPTPQQLEAAQVLERGDRQVLIQGANGTGKDTLTALWALYEVYVLGALAILSGPTDRQVREVLMRRETGRLWNRAKGKLPGERYEMAIRIPGREQSGLLAFTATDPEKFVGHHAPRLFIGITEGQGVPAEIYEAAQRCLVGRGCLLVVGNPTQPSGPFFSASRSKSWTRLRWSALNHVNVVTGEERVPGAVTREWVESIRAEHGEGSRFWRIAVEALFPEDAEEQLIPTAHLDASTARWRCRELEGKAKGKLLVLGMDVARLGGDKTMIAVRQGGVVRKFVGMGQGGDHRVP